MEDLDLSGKRILIVDDEKMVRETLSEFFSLFGAKIDEADNGRTAFQLLMELEFDLVISDVRMPECSGIDLLNLIRDSKEKMPPVIMISAFKDISREKMQELGARDFILKTNDYNNILALVNETLT